MNFSCVYFSNGVQANLVPRVIVTLVQWWSSQQASPQRSLLAAPPLDKGN